MCVCARARVCVVYHYDNISIISLAYHYDIIRIIRTLIIKTRMVRKQHQSPRPHSDHNKGTAAVQSATGGTVGF